MTTETETLDAFADLSAQAADLDGAAVSMIEAQAHAEMQAADKQAADMVADLLDVLKMARGMAGTAFAWWQEYQQVWNDDVLAGIAANGAAIMARNGWTMGRLMSEWGPYIGLIGCMAPAAFATWRACKDRKGAEHVSHQ